MKLPFNLLFAPIYYYLEKSDGRNILGDYKGIWAFKEQVINLKIGYKPGIGEAVMVEYPPETSNKATLSLSG